MTIARKVPAKGYPKKYRSKNWDIYRLRGMLATITNIANDNPTTKVCDAANVASLGVGMLLKAVQNAK